MVSASSFLLALSTVAGIFAAPAFGPEENAEKTSMYETLAKRGGKSLHHAILAFKELRF
jgi:hypothetical protein